MLIVYFIITEHTQLLVLATHVIFKFTMFVDAVIHIIICHVSHQQREWTFVSNCCLCDLNCTWHHKAIVCTCHMTPYKLGYVFTCHWLCVRNCKGASAFQWWLTLIPYVKCWRWKKPKECMEPCSVCHMELQSDMGCSQTKTLQHCFARGLICTLNAIGM